MKTLFLVLTIVLSSKLPKEPRLYSHLNDEYNYELVNPLLDYVDVKVSCSTPFGREFEAVNLTMAPRTREFFMIKSSDNDNNVVCRLDTWKIHKQ